MRWWMLVAAVGCGVEGEGGEDDGLTCRPEDAVGGGDYEGRAACDCEWCVVDGDPVDGNHMIVTRCADGWEFRVTEYMEDPGQEALDAVTHHCVNGG